MCVLLCLHAFSKKEYKGEKKKKRTQLKSSLPTKCTTGEEATTSPKWQRSICYAWLCMSNCKTKKSYLPYIASPIVKPFTCEQQPNNSSIHPNVEREHILIVSTAGSKCCYCSLSLSLSPPLSLSLRVPVKVWLRTEATAVCSQACSVAAVGGGFVLAWNLFVFPRWKLGRAHYFHSLVQDQSTVAQRAGTTGPSVPWQVACELVSWQVPTLCLHNSIISPLWLRWVKGVCVFRSNLPPAL